MGAVLRLRQVRIERGLSQQALGELIHVSPQVLSGLENQRLRLRPTARTIQRLSQVLGIAPEDVLRPVTSAKR